MAIRIAVTDGTVKTFVDKSPTVERSGESCCQLFMALYTGNLSLDLNCRQDSPTN